MNFTFHQLRVFAKVAELESITKAAEELNLTQPAVSIQLKNLQDQFNVPLTEVIGRQLYVTDFGRQILETANRILREAELIAFTTRAHENGLAGKLSISVASTGKYVMPYFLSDFFREHRGIDLAMDVTNKTKVVRSLVENEVDFSLVSVIPDGLKTDHLQLLQNKLYLVGSPRLKLKKNVPKKRIFEEHPLLFREPGSATRKAMEEFINIKGLPTYKQIELTSNEALKQAVMAGLGYSIMPLIGIKNEINNGTLEIIPFPGLPITTHWNLIWLKEKRHSPVASAFLNYLLEHKEMIRQKEFDWYELFD